MIGDQPELLGQEPGAEAPPAPPQVKVAQAADTGVPDFERIDRNLQLLYSKKAPDDHITQYLQAEGVTADQVLASKRGVLGNAVKSVVDFTGKIERGLETVETKIGEAYRGKTDPAFKDVSGFSGEGITNPDFFDKMNFAKVVAPEDKNYGEMIKKNLGKRLLKSEKDMHEQEVITYRGDDGKEYRRYINAPGLDYQDVDRTVGNMLPYVAGGAAAGALLKTFPWLVRAGGQVATAGGTSVTDDVLAQRGGANITAGETVERAAVAGAGAAVGELLTPAVRFAWRGLIGKPGMLDYETGTLSEAGKRYAKEAGLTDGHIAQLEGEKAKEFAAAAAKALDPEEVASQFRTGEFGVQTTKGQRTKDPQVLQMEVEIRKGLWGEKAKSMMREFDKEQAEQIGSAVKTKIGSQLAPDQPGREMSTLAGSFQDAIRAAKSYVDEAENQLWGRVGPAFPKEEGFNLLKGRITKELQENHVWPDANGGQTPQTKSMLELLEGYQKNQLQQEGGLVEKSLPLIGGGKQSFMIDDIRRRLLKMQQSAEGYDKMNATNVYNGFNKWIDDLSDQAMLVMDRPDVAAKLKAARAFTKEARELFAPRDSTGQLTAAGKRLDTILKKADSPESMLDELLPSISGKARIGDVSVLKHMKEILTENGQAAAWDDVRLAYWVRLAQNNKGEILSPKLLKNRLDIAFEQQRPVLNQLFDKDEISLFKRFASSLEDATWVDPNPSGSSYAFMDMMRRLSGGQNILKGALQTQATRERFAKHNFLAAKIYSALARKLPINPLGAKEEMGALGAARVLDPRLAPSKGGAGIPAGVGAGVAVEMDTE